jgi:ferredoxin
MPYVISSLCRDCVDTACAAVCPVECIYEYKGEDKETFPNQLYIHPEECIDCGACEPECPWQAIFTDESIPEIFKDDILLNAKIMDRKDEFEVAQTLEKPKPTPEEVLANKRKWGLEA